MRMFWYNEDNKGNPLTLLSDTCNDRTASSRSLNFPPEIIQRIIDFLPRSRLSSVSCINRAWYSTAMPVLYRHLYIRTLPHWLLLIRTMKKNSFASQFGPCIHSVVLKPSPKLIPSQLMSYLNQAVVENDDRIQPSLRGYVRLERVDYNLTGLETIEMPMMKLDEQQQKEITGAAAVANENENYKEVDTTQKESEWLAMVTDDQMTTVLRYASNLEYLNLNGCENLHDNVLLGLAESKQNGGKALKGIWISLLREQTPVGLTELMKVEKKNHYRSEDKKVEKKGLQLKHLDLGFHMLTTDESVKSICSFWGNTLTHLRLNSIHQLTDLSVEYIARYCPNIELLHLVRCWQINNASLKLLSERCKKLKYVSVAFLGRTNEEGIKYLVWQCPDLLWLDITSCGINSLFKPIILESWKNYRIEHGLKPIDIQDGSVNFL